MSTSLQEVIDEVTTYKNLATAFTKSKEYERASKFLSVAVGKLAPHVPLDGDIASPPTKSEKQAASLLADCYGSLGGTRRREGLYQDSQDAYDNGYRIESHERYGIVNSYNMVQRLLARILTAERAPDSPTALERLPVGDSDVRSELESADKKIQEQMDGPRHGDRWAMADLAMTRLLLGLDTKADAAWSRFEQSKPSADLYQSNIDVLSLLASKLADGELKSVVEKTIVRLEKDMEHLTT